MKRRRRRDNGWQEQRNVRLHSVAADNLDHQCNGRGGLAEVPAERAIVVLVIVARGRLRRMMIVMRTSGAVVVTNGMDCCMMRVRMAKAADNRVERL